MTTDETQAPQPLPQPQQKRTAPKGAPPSQPPPPPHPDPDARRRQLAKQAQHEARIARELLIPGALSVIVDSPEVGPLGCREYERKFVEDAGAPTDPVELVLIQQLLLAHHRTAKLHARAEKARNIDEIKLLSTAATRLLSEIRRFALAIRQYRSPIASKNFTVVHQQNLATGADQRVTYVDQSTKDQENVSFTSRTELNAKPTEESDAKHQSGRTGEEPASRSRLSDQWLQAAAVDA